MPGYKKWGSLARGTKNILGFILGHPPYMTLGEVLGELCLAFREGSVHSARRYEGCMRPSSFDSGSCSQHGSLIVLPYPLIQNLKPDAKSQTFDP